MWSAVAGTRRLLKDLARPPVTACLRAIYHDALAIKPIKDSRQRLAYPIAGHLLFLGAREIDYEPDSVAVFRSAARPGDLVFDIGANIGQTAVLFAEIVGPAGAVVALEPTEAAFNVLQINKTLNGLEHLLPVRRAAGAMEGSAEIVVDTRTGGRTSSLRSIASGGPRGATQSVRVTTLDALTAEHGVPDFVKIDVEGWELEVLRGAAMDTYAPATRFFIEVRQDTMREVLATLGAHGYRCRLLEQGRLTPVSAESCTPAFGNLFCVPGPETASGR